MFAIDTGAETGSAGPWMAWSSNGSAMKEIAAKSWVLRGKDADGVKFENNIPAFTNGCVIDIDSIKLGWEKDGGQGMAPERRWNPSLAQSTPRPSEDKKPTGGFVWSKALSMRVAIGGGEAATWEQGNFAAYEGFSRLAKQITAQFPGDNTLPLVKMTGVETIKLPNGVANVPLLEIEKWVPRPDCLKADAPQIATSEPAPAPKPAAEAAQAAAPADAEF